GSRMYGHGITTLMLSEMLGMGVDAQMDQVIRDRCRLAVELIKRSQSFEKDANNRGGWRYAPNSTDSDLSATVWQAMALRSARNAGMDVLKEKKIEYGGEWFCYATYYFAQGMFQRGGEYSTHSRKLVEELLLPKQGPDGSWQGQSGQERGVGKVYATSLGVLSLAVKFHFLPIYQR